MIKTLEEILRLADQMGDGERALLDSVTSVHVVTMELDELSELRKLSAEICEPDVRFYTVA